MSTKTTGVHSNRDELKAELDTLKAKLSEVEDLIRQLIEEKNSISNRIIKSGFRPV